MGLQATVNKWGHVRSFNGRTWIMGLCIMDSRLRSGMIQWLVTTFEDSGSRGGVASETKVKDASWRYMELTRWTWFDKSREVESMKSRRVHPKRNTNDPNYWVQGGENQGDGRVFFHCQKSRDWTGHISHHMIGITDEDSRMSCMLLLIQNRQSRDRKGGKGPRAKFYVTAGLSFFLPLIALAHVQTPIWPAAPF